ncbi:MAG: FkbM family methyltransferase, partial [Proteobacteria bacterium]|nr:FkbM family methyltransferase [Pseudomonadota bacterium]
MEKSVLPEPNMALDHEGVRLRYYTPNAQTRWRVESLYTKEPDTIDWLCSMTREDLLFDVGANVGMYTIFAAATRGTRVLAFEPEAQNYGILNTNIHGNG